MAARLASPMACAARSASLGACKPLQGQRRAGLKPPASRTSCCRRRLRRGVLPATVAASRRPEEDEGTIEKDELTHELTPDQEEMTRELTLSSKLQVSSQPGTAWHCLALPGACGNCCLARGRSRLLYPAGCPGPSAACRRRQAMPWPLPCWRLSTWQLIS